MANRILLMQKITLLNRAKKQSKVKKYWIQIWTPTWLKQKHI